MTLKTVGLVGAFCVLACGEAGPDARDNSGPESSNREFPLQDGDATICSIREVPFGDETSQQPELYRFSAINDELATLPGLAETFGKSTVNNCEDARDFVAARAAFLGEPDVSSAAPSVPIDKVYNGDSAIEPGVVALLIQYGGNPGAWHWCSGFVINAKAIVTAAHCTVGNATARRMYIGYKNTDGTIKWLNSGNEFKATTYAHAGYSGAGDADDDIGMIVSNDSEYAWSFGSHRRLLIQTTQTWVGAQYKIYGWGNQWDTGNSAGVDLTTGQDGTSISVSWFNSGHFTNNAVSGGALACKGDSGGPAIRHGGTSDAGDAVVGLASSMADSTGNCPDTDGGYSRWTRVANRMAWIENILDVNNLISGSTCASGTMASNSSIAYKNCW
ncbi:MAG TPA: S1 family peptidase [Polyangiaceae bacterium]|jgi:hypothetical protein|nr:S1 family peptidase [Polyangiaceae bacterium]